MITFVKNWFAPTFIDFACNWLEHEYARHAPVSLPKKRQLLEKSVFPFIGQKRITHVKYQDIVKIILAYRQTARHTGGLENIVIIYHLPPQGGFYPPIENWGVLL